MMRPRPRSVPTPPSFPAVLASIAVLAACSSSAPNQTLPGIAELDSPITGPAVIVNARVYTVNPNQPTAEAFAYDAEGIITSVGTTAEVLESAPENVAVVDAGGQMILPGFQDVHVHVPEAGIYERYCPITTEQDLAAYQDAVAACAVDQPGDGWVRAAGPSLYELRDTAKNPIDVLDRAVPNRPVLILDDLGHAAWTNTAGLEAAGIGEDDPDPQGGIFYRDPTTGRLTGLLLESAQTIVRRAAANDADTNYRGLLDSLPVLASHGITTVSDAGGYWGEGHPEAWLRGEAEGTLTVRAINTLYVYPDLDPVDQLAELDNRFHDDPISLVRFNTAKIYVDGILDLGTALLHEPYNFPLDPDHPSGFAYFETDQLNDYVNRLHRMGYRVNFHVIGDRAATLALDAVAEIADSPEAIADRRHRTTHSYLIATADLPRFAELGVIADFQAGAASLDPYYASDLSELIGDRARHLIPVDETLAAGATVTLSSDWDADPLSPVGTIERALTNSLVPDLETAIRLVTIEPAYALGHDNSTGSIEVGKFADFVVLDQDLFEIDTPAISNTNVTLTVLAGREVFRG